MYSNFSIHFSSPERLYFVQKKKTSSNKTALIKKNIPQGKRRGQGWTTSLKISKRGFATHFEAEMGIDPSYVPPSPRVRRSLPHKGENLWKGLKYRGRIRHSNWRESKRFTFSSCNATYRYTPLSREQRAGIKSYVLCLFSSKSEQIDAAAYWTRPQNCSIARNENTPVVVLRSSLCRYATLINKPTFRFYSADWRWIIFFRNLPPQRKKKFF